MSSSVQRLEETGSALRSALANKDWTAIGELDLQCRQAVDEAMVEAVLDEDVLRARMQELLDLYRELVGEYPDAAGFTVNATIYTPRTRFFPPLLASEKVELRGDTVSGHSYSTDAVTAARTLARSPPP